MLLYILSVLIGIFNCVLCKINEKLTSFWPFTDAWKLVGLINTFGSQKKIFHTISIGFAIYIICHSYIQNSLIWRWSQMRNGQLQVYLLVRIGQARRTDVVNSCNKLRLTSIIDNVCCMSYRWQVIIWIPRIYLAA